MTAINSATHIMDSHHDIIFSVATENINNFYSSQSPNKNKKGLLFKIGSYWRHNFFKGSQVSPTAVFLVPQIFI